MIKSDTSLFHSPFHYIYIEEDILGNETVRQIVEKYSNSVIIPIHHYKDIFCRNHQSSLLQKKALSLILAKKEGNLFYKGAPVCEHFGNKSFYYTSCMMNCIYQCDYCYLQGMYNSGNIVVFVNLDDYFTQLDALLLQKEVYLCISYDSDLLALESVTGYIKRWIAYAKKQPRLTIEIRTKCTNISIFKEIEPVPNVIIAWTLTPDVIAQRFEHHVPSTKARILAVKKMANLGYTIRLCFDPIIYHKDWAYHYKNLFDTIFHEVPFTAIKDVSLGVFRVSKDYLKRMRKQNPNASLLFYPYTLRDGVYEYSQELTHTMIDTLRTQLLSKIDSDRIFVWEDTMDGGNQE